MAFSRTIWLVIGAALTLGAVPMTACDDGDENIRAPEGFVVQEYAGGLKSPTAMVFDSDGRLFVTEIGAGRVTVFTDVDGDGRADSRHTFAEGLTAPLGLAFGPDGRLYVSSRGQVGILVDRDDDGDSDYMVGIILDLPNGLHQNNGIAFGPDGMLYVTNGSTCNICDEDDPRSATILRADASGGDDVEVYARGLRNPYDIAFGPDGRLWATDNGPDPPEVSGAPDELNLVVEGGHYGWPDCHGRSIEVAEGACDESFSPVVEFDPHSSSDGIVYYEAESFPPEYRDGLFIAQWGNNQGRPESGHRVMWVAAGSAVPASSGEADLTLAAEEFASGFTHPLAVEVGPDGSLYVADHGSGKIYRIGWEEE